MSEPQLTDPVPQTHDLPTDANTGSIQADPLLDGGSFIDPHRTDSAAESPQNQHHNPIGNPNFPPGVVIAAEPIRMYPPGDDKEESAPKSARRRNPEEMSKRPEWLPENWTIDLKVRTSGATAGLIDRYYVEPLGQRKFRSKNEVLHYLETGNHKKKPTSETDAKQSGSPASVKQKKSSTKRKKPEVFNPDIAHSTHGNGV